MMPLKLKFASSQLIQVFFKHISHIIKSVELCATSLDFQIPLSVQPGVFFRTNRSNKMHSLKYEWSTTSGCKDIWIEMRVCGEFFF